MIEIFQVDAFTNKAFSGNPAAICILKEPKEEGFMQSLAKEMNLSETAFLLEKEDGYSLRWFTPSMEIDLCGHATLASAYVLWENGNLSRDKEAKFYTKSGILKAKIVDNWIQLDFPALSQEPFDPPKGLIEALGIEPIYIGKSKSNYLIQVESEDEVRNMKPNYNEIMNIPMHGVMVTSISKSPEYDFVSRFFAPEAGIFEDPVTGSAHCCLGPFWKGKLGKDTFMAYQASHRGGRLKVQVADDRVLLSGEAVMIFRGELL